MPLCSVRLLSVFFSVSFDSLDSSSSCLLFGRLVGWLAGWMVGSYQFDSRESHQTFVRSHDAYVSLSFHPILFKFRFWVVFFLLAYLEVDSFSCLFRSLLLSICSENVEQTIKLQQPNHSLTCSLALIYEIWNYEKFQWIWREKKMCIKYSALFPRQDCSVHGQFGTLANPICGICVTCWDRESKRFRCHSHWQTMSTFFTSTTILSGNFVA